MEVELASIQAGVALTGDLAGLERTEAILAVLRDAGAMLSPKEIEQRLEAGGRSDTYRTITATLDHLMKLDKVTRLIEAATWPCEVSSFSECTDLGHTGNPFPIPACASPCDN